MCVTNATAAYGKTFTATVMKLSVGNVVGIRLYVGLIKFVRRDTG